MGRSGCSKPDEDAFKPDHRIRLEPAGLSPLVNLASSGYLGFISPTLAPERVEACLLAGKASRASSDIVGIEDVRHGVVSLGGIC